MTTASAAAPARGLSAPSTTGHALLKEMHLFYDGGAFMGGMHFLWWIFWVALVAAIVFYGWGRPSEQRRRPRETPHEMLQRRLASGEISPEEYERRKALLDRDVGAKT